ncbi:B-cell linker protein isoform X4 [Pantherophis guttatus]|uniref:B-cell linker protein isoform X4 n=1 Tax=Pantherophis guttatus TaxID=94885 RepID=A0A6P9CPA3_PANGU|nr:B-cell linker protein isoform X4 [Pantherophis guttatus]
MTTKLPVREEFETWTSLQVADLLRQSGMHDCARIVEKLNIDGVRFLHLSEYERHRFSIMDQPQLQKIVHDIKKNDSGIMSKFKKFQNEQVALICKTGKNTWDRLTSKPPPSIPPVDYVPDRSEEEEQWSDDFDSDYENPDHHSDSEMYVVPTEENCDDSYEPPPSEHEPKTVPIPFTCAQGVYADDKRSSKPKTWPSPILPNQSASLSKKPATLPLPPPAVQKPKLPPKRMDDEADYVVPVDDEDDEDNYIEPTEESTSQPVKPPVVNRSTKPPCSVPSPSTLDVYEVPEEEQKSSPPLLRISKPLPPKPALRPSGGLSHERSIPKESFTSDTFKSDRNILPLPRHRPSPKADPEVIGAQTDGNNSSNGATEFKLPSVNVPSPFPRITKKQMTPAIPPKPSLPDRDHLNIAEDKPIPAERRRGSSHDMPLPPIPSSIQKPLPQKPPILSRSPEPASHTIRTRSNSLQAEQDAGVLGQAWYMASSDRKIAEEALYRSNKDGSFLVRKSSGQDSKQPYTLVVFYNKRVYNIPIRFIESERQYALGREKTGEEHFDSVAEIIENHQRTSLVLIDSQNNTKDSTRLKYIARVL